MTKLELGTIISKVFALYYFFEALSAIMPSIMGLYGSGINQYILFVLMTQFIAPFVMFILFWFGAEMIGKRIVGKDNQKDIGTFKNKELIACVFVGFGCLFLYKIVPIVADPLYVLFSNPETRKRYVNNGEMTKDMIQASLYFVLSMYFIFGASGLQKTVFWLRGLGNKPK